MRPELIPLIHSSNPIEITIGSYLSEQATNDEILNYLSTCSENKIPFTQSDIQISKVALKQIKFIGHEFKMNYFRFCISAVVSLAATCFILSEYITDYNLADAALISACSASISGFIGLCVTKIRAINLKNSSQNKSYLLGKLEKRYSEISWTLIDIYFKDNNRGKNLAKNIRENFISSISFFSNQLQVKENELKDAIIPLQQTIDYIETSKSPTCLILSTAIRLNRLELKSPIESYA